MSKPLKTILNFQNIAIIALIAIFFVADRFLKALALNSQMSAPKNLIADIILFSFKENYQMALSLPWGGLSLLIAATLVTLIVFYLIIKNIYQEKRLSISALLLTIVLFGAISNLIDRYSHGFVIDYLEIKNLTIFNLADAMITVPTIFLLIYTLKNEHRKKN